MVCAVNMLVVEAAQNARSHSATSRGAFGWHVDLKILIEQNDPVSRLTATSSLQLYE
jgi:hypothetical protein